jgi:hypothetical protein
MTVLPAVTAVLLHRIGMDIWTDCTDVCTGKRGNGGLPAGTAEMLHHIAMDIWSYCCFVSTG